MDRVEPQSASDYDDRTTAAVKSVLVELGQVPRQLQGQVRSHRRRGAVALAEPDGDAATSARPTSTSPSMPKR